MDSRRRSRIPLIAAVVVTTAALLGVGTAVSVLATRQPGASTVGTSTITISGPLAGELPTAQAPPPGPATPVMARPLLQRKGSGDTRMVAGQSSPGAVLDIYHTGDYRLDYWMSAGCVRYWWMIEMVSDGAVLHRDGWFISKDTDPASGSRTHRLTEGTYYVQVLSTIAADSSVINSDCTWSYAVSAAGS